MYSFPVATSHETAVDFIHRIITDNPALLNRFRKVYIIYGYLPSVLVPDEFMQEKDIDGMLELVFGADSQRVTKAHFIPGHAMYNVYGIPAVIEQAFFHYFEFAAVRHLYSLLPVAVNGPANNLYCIFRHGQLLVTLYKEGKLQVIQNYSFNIPEDAAYHLLMVCKSFEVNATDIKVRLSGMIDESSVLFITLNKYFLHMQFEGLPGQYQYPEELKQHPSHYFSHLFAIAACV